MAQSYLKKSKESTCTNLISPTMINQIDYSENNTLESEMAKPVAYVQPQMQHRKISLPNVSETSYRNNNGLQFVDVHPPQQQQFCPPSQTWAPQVVLMPNNSTYTTFTQAEPQQKLFSEQRASITPMKSHTRKHNQHLRTHAVSQKKVTPWNKLLLEMKSLQQRGSELFRITPASTLQKLLDKDDQLDYQRHSSEESEDHHPAMPVVVHRDPFVHESLKSKYDYDVGARDLFPWISSLFDTCCTSNKNRRRYNQSFRQKNSMQLETVCLDCGSVLHDHTNAAAEMQTVFPTKAPWVQYWNEENTALSHAQHKFKGYEHWDIEAENNGWEKAHYDMKYTPLPAFQPGPTRLFRNTPHENDFNAELRKKNRFKMMDKKDNVIPLPEFPENVQT